MAPKKKRMVPTYATRSRGPLETPVIKKGEETPAVVVVDEQEIVTKMEDVNSAEVQLQPIVEFNGNGLNQTDINTEQGMESSLAEIVFINVPEQMEDEVIVIQQDMDNVHMQEPKRQKGEKRDADACSYAIKTIFLRCPQTQCPVVFPNKKERSAHLFNVHKISPFMCPQDRCHNRFESSILLSNHIREVHRNVLQWKCPQCSSIFKKYKLLYMHQWIMHDEGRFQCPHEDCTFEATYRKQIYNHIDHRHQFLKCKCPFSGCTKTFSTKNELKAHERRVHLLLKPYRCKWPGCSYSSEVCPAVIRHIRTQHFHLPETMRKQKEKNIVDLRNPREYLDIICDPNKVYAVLTPANNTQNEPKRFVCQHEGCNKSFVRATNLKIHERTHLGLKPYQCTFGNCDFSAERRDLVLQHVRISHFNLPRSMKEQREKNITDQRNPSDYIKVAEDQFDDPATKAAIAAMIANPTTNSRPTFQAALHSPAQQTGRQVAVLFPPPPLLRPELPPLDPSPATPTAVPRAQKAILTSARIVAGRENSITRNRPSGPKSGPTTESSAQRKQRGSKPEHVCQHDGCGKTFRRPANLKDHERIHLGIKPYRCAYGSCLFASGRKENVIQHIRTNHFHLPRSVKEQKEKQIEDSRDPADYVEVIQELLA